MNTDPLPNYLENAESLADSERLLAGDGAQAQWRRGLDPLRLLADDCPVPPGLGDRAVRHAVRVRLPSESAEPRRSWAPRSRLDVAVAFALLLAFTGLLTGGLGRLAQSHALQVCRNNLFRYHQGLDIYATTHGGHFPDGEPAAGTFVTDLVRNGVLDPRTTLDCPALRVSSDARSLDYAYALGYRGPDGRHHGPCRAESGEGVALLADRPLSGWVPRPATGNHSDGANVLFSGGHVRFCTVPTVGINAEHIYVNDDHRIAAGLHANDAVLGEKDDRP